MKEGGLDDHLRTNNIAEASNAVFKMYLQNTGVPNKDLSTKKTYEVLAATRSYLESEWQGLDRASYMNGEYVIKNQYEKTLLKRQDQMPSYFIPTANDNIQKINDMRTGDDLFHK